MDWNKYMWFWWLNKWQYQRIGRIVAMLLRVFGRANNRKGGE